MPGERGDGLGVEPGDQGAQALPLRLGQRLDVVAEAGDVRLPDDRESTRRVALRRVGAAWRVAAELLDFDVSGLVLGAVERAAHAELPAAGLPTVFQKAADVALAARA
mgnify:CR=1 FL=1